jgi:hypothetical protein
MARQQQPGRRLYAKLDDGRVIEYTVCSGRDDLCEDAIMNQDRDLVLLGRGVFDHAE